jgi:hypothetical protein
VSIPSGKLREGEEQTISELREGGREGEGGRGREGGRMEEMEGGREGDHKKKMLTSLLPFSLPLLPILPSLPLPPFLTLSTLSLSFFKTISKNNETTR